MAVKKTMRYRSLGFSGLKVSELCLGAMTFGEEFGIGAAETECRRVYDRFLEAGGNFVDTANIYNRGTSERMLAGFIHGNREYLVLATKYTLSTRPDDPNAGGNHRKNLVQSLEASLRRLQTDYVDLYWVHGWDRMTPSAEVMRALDDQVRLGKVLHIGISNAPAWVVAAANTLARERQLTPFCALQLHYNLVERAIERDFFAMAREFDMAITAWSPLASGLLSGKYATGEGAEGRLAGSARGARLLTPENLAVARALSAMAGELGVTAAQLALAWVCQRGDGQTIPIIGARTAQQLEENLACLELVLGPEQLQALDALSPPVPEYPVGLLENPMFESMMLGTVGQEIMRPRR